MLVGLWQERNISPLLVKLLWKLVWRFFKKLGLVVPFDLAIPFLGIFPEELKASNHSDICIPMFIATKFVIAHLGSSPNVHQAMNG